MSNTVSRPPLPGDQRFGGVPLGAGADDAVVERVAFDRIAAGFGTWARSVTVVPAQHFDRFAGRRCNFGIRRLNELFKIRNQPWLAKVPQDLNDTGYMVPALRV